MSASVVLRKATTWSFAMLLSGSSQPFLATLTVGGLNAALLSSASAATCVTSVTPTFTNVVSDVTGTPGTTVVTAVTPTMASALTNVTANPGPVPFLTNGTTFTTATGTGVTSVTPITGTGVASVTPTTGTVTGITPGSSNPNLVTVAVDTSSNSPNNAPPAKFAFSSNASTTTSNGGTILWTNTNNPGTVGPLLTVPLLNGTTTNTTVVTGVTAPTQTVVTNVTSTPGTFLTGATFTPATASAVTSVTPTSAAFVNGLTVTTAPTLTDVTPTRAAVVNSVAGSNSGASAATSSLGCGVSDAANGTNAAAYGNNALAGTNSVAVGQNALAPGVNDTALGQHAYAGSANSTAVGNNAASGVNSVAVGQNAQALGVGSTAIGQGASTGTFNNAMAIGNGAVATRDNQVVIGTTSNTYTTPGITSAASRAAQSGPLQLVTSDANGNLATDGGAFFNNLNTLNQQVANIAQDVRRLDGGVAMAMALGGVYLPEHQTVAVHADLGFYNGVQAFAIQGVARINQTFTVNAGAAFDVSGTGNGVGGRVGVSAGW